MEGLYNLMSSYTSVSVFLLDFCFAELAFCTCKVLKHADEREG